VPFLYTASSHMIQQGQWMSRAELGSTARTFRRQTTPIIIDEDHRSSTWSMHTCTTISNQLCILN